MTGDSTSNGLHSKRKRDDELAELEVDLKAAEPPSKKALRKAKRSKDTAQLPEEISLPLKKSSFKEVPDSNNQQEQNAMSNKARSGHGIWIGNLVFSTTKEDLMAFITSDTHHPIGEDQVTRIHLPSGPPKLGKPQNKGFAYIDFTDSATLKRSLELSEKLLGGRRVLIKDATDYKGRPTNKEDLSKGKVPSRRIFVGNLPFEATQESLEEHFGVCGPISKSQVATFEDSGKCKGFAWVEFEQLSSAQAAMRGWVESGSDERGPHAKKRLWLKKLFGRELRLEFAEDAATRYNKRYGKERERPVGNEGDHTAERAPKEAVEATRKPQSTWEKRPAREQPERSRQRQGYEQDTVKRLTGAMVESQGKKVLFD